MVWQALPPAGHRGRVVKKPFVVCGVAVLALTLAGCIVGKGKVPIAVNPPEPISVGLPPAPPPPPKVVPRNRLRPARNISIPSRGQTSFVPNEVLLEVDAGAAAELARAAAALQLTRLQTQSFALTNRTVERWRIDGNRSVADTLRALARYRGIAAAQPNYLYRLQQTAEAKPSDPGDAQYVISKLHLREAHRVSNGDDVVVAVIDSKVDTGHPDLAGVIAGDYDALGGAGAPHAHGTAMAGAIAAHAKLMGVAPRVRLLAVRAFAGEGESAQGTTVNVLKGLDWAASQGARIVNMSFAGPRDAMLDGMLAKAHARGIVLVAAVGNAGPSSPPLYPAADRYVIGVTATDAKDALLPQANRGRQVAVAAPGVDILAIAPNGQYQVTSGTSVAAAHASGVAALLLARKPDLTPDALRRALIRSARHVAGKPRDVGAGVIDAYGAVEAVAR